MALDHDAVEIQIRTALDTIVGLTVKANPPDTLDDSELPLAIVQAGSGEYQEGTLAEDLSELVTFVIELYVARRISPTSHSNIRQWAPDVATTLFTHAGLNAIITRIARITWEITQIEYASREPYHAIRFSVEIADL